MLMEKIMKIILKETNHKMQLLRPFEIINQATDYDVNVMLKVEAIQVKLEQWFMVFLKRYYNLMLNLNLP